MSDEQKALYYDALLKARERKVNACFADPLSDVCKNADKMREIEEQTRAELNYYTLTANQREQVEA